jgi:cysteinyl-tRNA synthetase
MDFVLWKPSKEGEPSWPSPCGIKKRGRPGWHIECSAMAEKHLGEVFDIHGGGIDLVFPHHENEIAQSRCAHGTDVMARFWLHNGFLQVEGEKMSKSLGNFITIHELLKEWPGEVLRFNMLRTHYRQPIDWTRKGLEESWKTLDEWYALSEAGAPTEFSSREQQAAPTEPVLSALLDDLNTPKAIAELHQLRNAAVHGAGLTYLIELIRTLRFLGFLKESATQWASHRQGDANIDTSTVQSLIDARTTARKAKNFKDADRIRDELAAMGVALKDSKDPKTGEIVTTWEVAR